MTPYLGVVIAQSLKDPSLVNSFDIVARQQDPHGSWVFLVVRALDDNALSRIQVALDTAEPWYAHFFRGDELVVIFADALFRATTNPETWADILTHGIKLGIPKEQLDFEPHTIDGLEQRFGIRLE